MTAHPAHEVGKRKRLGRKGGTISKEEWKSIVLSLNALKLSKSVIGQICTAIAEVFVDQRKWPPRFNDPNDPDSEVVIDDEPPHTSITVGELRKRRAHEVGKEQG